MEIMPMTAYCQTAIQTLAPILKAYPLLDYLVIVIAQQHEWYSRFYSLLYLIILLPVAFFFSEGVLRCLNMVKDTSVSMHAKEHKTPL